MPAQPPLPPVPIWGIEVGSGFLRAARIVRSEGGRVAVLAHEESRTDRPPAEALAAYVKKRHLAEHPLVIAIASPAPHFGTVTLTPEEMLSSADELREGFLERVHPEPEVVDLRYMRVGSAVWLLCAEERARVESTMAALESVGVRTYGLLCSADALHLSVRQLGRFEGDGIVVHVQPEWTEFLFLDGPAIRRQSLPIGSRELEDPARISLLAADFRKLLEYHRCRVSRDAPERIVLTGLGGALRDKVAAALPAPPVPFPGDAALVDGLGRVKPGQARELLSLAPAAIGAAAAAALAPRRLDLAFRPLPETLTLPKPSSRAFIAAAAVLWLAFGAAYYGAHLRKAAPLEPAPSLEREAPADMLRATMATAQRALSFPRALGEVLSLLPGEAAAPFTTRSISIDFARDGSYQAELALRLPALDAGNSDQRRAELDRRAESAGLVPPKYEAEPGGSAIAVFRFRGEASR